MPRPSRRRLAGVLTVAMVAGSLMLAPATSLSAKNSKVVKAKRNNTFDPAVKRIKEGQSVTWKAPKNGEDHSVVAYEGDWVSNQALYAGNDFAKEFENAGVYKYYCVYFGEVTDGQCEGMCGEVRVKKD